MLSADFDTAILGIALEKAAFFGSVGSTNDVVAEWARQGVKGLAIAAADEQTRGRGRAGRRWITPAGSALALSVLLDTQPNFDTSLLGRTSGLGALAVCQALEQLYALKPQIKWPNDVLLDGGKVCGVLPESHWTGAHLQALILGIGINVAPLSVPLPQALNFPATCVEEVLGKHVDPSDLLKTVLEGIVTWKEIMHTAEFIDAWQKRLAYLGQDVRLVAGEGAATEAKVIGLTGEGALIMQLPSGIQRAFQIGEIQLRPLV